MASCGEMPTIINQNAFSECGSTSLIRGIQLILMPFIVLNVALHLHGSKVRSRSRNLRAASVRKSSTNVDTNEQPCIGIKSIMNKH